MPLLGSALMDKIFIDRLEVFANHGVLDEEKALGQKFFVSATIELDFKKAAAQDDLEQTINYAQVCDDIVNVMTRYTFDLIETAADRICTYILRSYNALAVTIRIDKPSAPVVHSLQSVAVQVHRFWADAYLALGSNMGNTHENLDIAVKEILHPAIKLLKTSSYHHTKAVSEIPQDDYLNAALQIRTFLTPHELLEHINQIENKLGRTRTPGIIHEPRTIDIDIIFYNSLTMHTDNLIIPHPLAHKRTFVLAPLNEIAPHYIHPTKMQSIIELLNNLK